MASLGKIVFTCKLAMVECSEAFVEAEEEEVEEEEEEEEEKEEDEEEEEDALLTPIKPSRINFNDK